MKVWPSQYNEVSLRDRNLSATAWYVQQCSGSESARHPFGQTLEVAAVKVIAGRPTSSMSFSGSRIRSECLCKPGRIKEGDLGLNWRFLCSANVPQSHRGICLPT